MLAPALSNRDPEDMLEIPVEEYPQESVPGWDEMDAFLQEGLSIRNTLALKHFRSFYNHYLRRFPVHYFTEQSIPQLDFVLFFPVGPRRNGINKPHYFVAFKPKRKPLVLFRRSFPHHVKTTKNFHQMTRNWLSEGYPHSINHHDITELLQVCTKAAEHLLPMLSVPFRSARLEGFLSMAQRKLKNVKQGREFKDKWPAIREYMNARDKLYIETLIERIKTRHISVEAARTAKMLDKERNIDIYNWLIGGEDDTAIRNRVQATRAFPWLGKLLTNNEQLTMPVTRKVGREVHITQMHTEPVFDNVTAVIDKGEPLIPALQEALSDPEATRFIRASTVRKLSRLHIQGALVHLNIGTLRSVMQGIDTYAPDMPLKPGGFERMAHAADEGKRAYAYLNSNLFEILGAMNQDEKDNFFESKTNPAAYGNTLDFLVEAYRKLVLPYFAAKAFEYGVPLNDMAERYIRGDLDKDSFISRNQGQIRHPPHLRPFGNMSFMNMTRLSELWHMKENQQRYVWRKLSLNLPPETQWPALTPEVSAPNGIKITPRASQSALMEEFHEMNHCIHGFAPNCLGLRTEKRFPGAHVFSHIFKIASANNAHRATLGLFEVRPLSGGAPSLHMDHVENRRTHHDVENHASEKSPETVAARWFFNEIAQGKIKIDWNRIALERAQMRTGRKLDDIFVEIGFDPRDPVKREQAYLALRPYLPERFRTASYAEWADKMHFEDDAKALFIQPMGPGNDPYRLNHVYD